MIFFSWFPAIMLTYLCVKYLIKYGPLNNDLTEGKPIGFFPKSTSNVVGDPQDPPMVSSRVFLL